MTDILMPALSPTMEEGVLAKWHVKVGDVVSAGDVIAEIETDKATMEVEAVDEGTIAKILVPAGTADVPVNQLIAVLAADGEDVQLTAYAWLADAVEAGFVSVDADKVKTLDWPEGLPDAVQAEAARLRDVLAGLDLPPDAIVDVDPISVL